MSLGRPKPEPTEAPYVPERKGPPCARCGAATATERQWRDEVCGHAVCRPCWLAYCDAPDRPRRLTVVEQMELSPDEFSGLFAREREALRAWAEAWVKRGTK